ncbi:RFT1 -like protein [Brachionus plicatilis]|uniref:Protein RFT1 homolog n=1 Tax=Brachionus plicatilis TaxID=10195 RepID=A0A3M7REQ5_BRAPC|nr:RFT1 -like protein [Brachionus plicatilis]
MSILLKNIKQILKFLSTNMIILRWSTAKLIKEIIKKHQSQIKIISNKILKINNLIKSQIIGMSEKLESFLFKSISYNMILQLTFRLLSFVLNAVLYRNVHTDLIGACNFRLALLYTTVMFLSREPFRRALPTMSDVKQFDKFVNSLWLVIPSGFVISLFFGILWNFFEKPSQLTVTNYDYSIILLSCSCLIELVGEPSYALSQMFFLAKLRVIIEASCLLIFNLIFICLAIFFPQLGALSYSIARFVNSVLFVASNFYFILKQKPNLTLKSLLPNSMVQFDTKYLQLVRAYCTQSLFKQILTEGERYLITFFNLMSYSESGVYDIVNNLGSLLARFVFLPIEDASYVYFTNSLQRGVQFKNQMNTKSKSYFEFLLKGLSTIGLVVLVFGQSYSKLLLQIYGGDKLSQNDLCINLLRFHCVYIYLLGINGLTEGFFNATMSQSEINKHNYRLVLFSILFFECVLDLWVFGGQLSQYASQNYIQLSFKFKNDKCLSDAVNYDIYCGFVPNLKLACVYLCGLLVTKISEHYFAQNFICHFLIGVVVFGFTCAAILIQETQIKEFVSYPKF